MEFFRELPPEFVQFFVFFADELEDSRIFMSLSANQILECLAYVAVASVCVIPLLFLNLKFALPLGFVDWPKARGVSDNQIPIVGYGLVLFGIFTLFGLTFYGLSPWFVATAIFMALMGHWDDRKPLPPQDKFFWQVLCVSVLILFDPNINQAITEHYGAIGSVLAFFFVLGLTNAINFIDGIDGLAGIVLLTGSISFLLLLDGSPTLFPHMVFNCVVIGVLLPFFYLNMKRKGFLGNVGSYFFGFTIAATHLGLFLDSSYALSRLSISGLCFLVPIADGCTVSLLRLLMGRTPFEADKSHLHHRLIQSEVPLRYILCIFAFTNSGGVLSSVFLASAPALSSSLFPVLLCTLQSVTLAALILLVGETSKARLRSYLKRLDENKPINMIKYELRRRDGSPVTRSTLKRIESRLSAEIRVTDCCFYEEPHFIYLALKSLEDPSKRIATRVEILFQAEGIEASLIAEQSELIKRSIKAAFTRPRLVNKAAKGQLG